MPPGLEHMNPLHHVDHCRILRARTRSMFDTYPPLNRRHKAQRILGLRDGFRTITQEPGRFSKAVDAGRRDLIIRQSLTLPDQPDTINRSMSPAANGIGFDRLESRLPDLPQICPASQGLLGLNSYRQPPMKPCSASTAADNPTNASQPDSSCNMVGLTISRIT